MRNQLQQPLCSSLWALFFLGYPDSRMTAHTCDIKIPPPNLPCSFILVGCCWILLGEEPPDSHTNWFGTFWLKGAGSIFLRLPHSSAYLWSVRAAVLQAGLLDLFSVHYPSHTMQFHILNPSLNVIVINFQLLGYDLWPLVRVLKQLTIKKKGTLHTKLSWPVLSFSSAVKVLIDPGSHQFRELAPSRPPESDSTDCVLYLTIYWGVLQNEAWIK